MKIKEIVETPSDETYLVIMEDGSQWHLEGEDSDDETPWMVYLGVSIADNSSELREQAKAMITFSYLIDALLEIFPDIEIDAEDDDHELCYGFSLDKDQIKELLDKYYDPTK